MRVEKKKLLVPLRWLSRMVILTLKLKDEAVRVRGVGEWILLLTELQAPWHNWWRWVSEAGLKSVELRKEVCPAL